MVVSPLKSVILPKSEVLRMSVAPQMSRVLQEFQIRMYPSLFLFFSIQYLMGMIERRNRYSRYLQN